MAWNKTGRGNESEGFNHKEKKIAQEFLSMVPELPKLLGRLNDRIEHFDVRQPMLLEAIALTKREASADSRYSLLLKLMHKADEAIPLVSMIVSVRHGDPESTLLPQCAPLAFLQQAERERGEVRATSVLDALRATSEFVYRPYLVTIWSLSYLKEREIPPAKVPDFGELVKQAHRRLTEFPCLVEPDAGWLKTRQSVISRHSQEINQGGRLEHDAFVGFISIPSLIKNN